VKAGSTCDLISSTLDMMPTFCELLNIKAPLGIDGLSILPTILGKGKQIQHDYLYFEYPEYGGQQAIRIGNWKGVRLNMMKGNDKWTLYDLATDIKEQNDVAATHPDIVKQMVAISKKEHHTPLLKRFEIPVLEKEEQ
jgi:arylsulfatase